MGNKETGGVVLAFFGLVLLIGAVKGTWQTAWKDLVGGPSTSTTTAANAKTGTSSGGSAGNGSSNLPGSGPAPTNKAPAAVTNSGG